MCSRCSFLAPFAILLEGATAATRPPISQPHRLTTLEPTLMRLWVRRQKRHLSSRHLTVSPLSREPSALVEGEGRWAKLARLSSRALERSNASARPPLGSSFANRSLATTATASTHSFGKHDNADYDDTPFILKLTVRWKLRSRWTIRASSPCHATILRPIPKVRDRAMTKGGGASVR